MTNITIHGKLGKIFGKNHRFELKRMSEVINAIEANSRGFRQRILSDFMSGSHYYFVNPEEPNKTYQRAEEFFHSKPPEELHIVPSIYGAGGIGEIIVGFILTQVAPSLGTGTLYKIVFNVGVALILSGVQKLLFPIEFPDGRGGSLDQESRIDTSSYIFSSLRNNAVQGFPIPLLYGELRVGSNIISTNVVSEDLGFNEVESDEGAPEAAGDSTSSDDVGGSTEGGGTQGSDNTGGSDAEVEVPVGTIGGEDDSETVVDVTDTTPPSAPSNIVANSPSGSIDTTPEFRGEAEAGSTVKMFSGSQLSSSQLLAAATTNSTGKFVITSRSLSPGAYTFRFIAIDAAGNTSAVTTKNHTIAPSQDVTAPNAPASLNLVAANTSTPTVAGNAEVGASVTMRKGSDLLATVTVGSNGVFFATSTVALADGTHTLTFRAQDQAGNISSASTLDITIDTSSSSDGVVQAS